MTDERARDDGEGRSERLEALLVAWFDRLEAGEAPSAEEHCAAAPDLLEDFRRIVETDSSFSETESRWAFSTASAPPAPPTPEAAEFDDDAPAGEQVGPAAMARKLGRVGDFDLLTRIGRGGRADVFLAQQRSLGRLVALKVLRDEGARDARIQKRFVREAELAASLDHPNIVPIYAVGEAKGRSYIAMKWLTGPGLDALDGAQDLRRVAEMGATIARALHAAHLAGITHRDIKPANLMLDGETLYVLDFGLARGMTDLSQTIEGKVSGTLPYMSPEQLSSSAATIPLDGRSDIYSLGATLYELVAGAPPFEVDDPGTGIRKILFAAPQRPSDCDRDLWTLLGRALEKAPKDRFQSAEEFAEDLERYARGLPIRSRPVGLLERGFKLMRRHRVASGLLGAALLATAVVSVVLLLRLRHEGATRDAAVAQIQAELDDDKPRVAKKFLAAFREAYPLDARVEALSRELRADELVAAVTDRLQVGFLEQDPEELATQVAEIDRLGAFAGRDAHRERWAKLRVAALIRAERDDDARAGLARVRSEYLREVFNARLAGRSWPWTITGRDGARAFDHLIAALVMHDADVPAAEQRVEIMTGLEKDDTNYRLRWQRMIWLSNHGRDASRVLAGLENLVAPDGRYSKGVRAGMLKEALKLRDYEKIRSFRARMIRDFPRAEWTHQQAEVVAKSYAVERRYSELRGILEWARPRWPKSYEFALTQARESMRLGEHESASAALAACRRLARTDRQRASAELYELQLAWARYQDGAIETPGEDFAARVRKLVDAAEDASVRGSAALIVLEHRVSLGLRVGEEQFQRYVAMATADSCPPAHWVRAAVLAYNLKLDELSLDYVDRYRALVDAGAPQDREAELQEHTVRAFVAFRRRDYDACASHLRRIEESRAESSMRAEVRVMLERMKRYLADR